MIALSLKLLEKTGPTASVQGILCITCDVFAVVAGMRKRAHEKLFDS